MATILLAVVLLLGLIAAVGWTAYWVDAVPGGDAGLATSPQLEAGRRGVLLFGAGLLTLGLVTAAVLLRARWGRRASR